MCPLCSTHRGRECASRVEECTEKVDCLRLGTLTLKDDGAGLCDRINRLLTAYRSLRKSDLWKRCVRGAVATLEVTMGGAVRHWHVHLHFVWDGDFMPQPQLKKAWFDATGDSFIVHVKKVHGRKEAAKYVAGYIAKPLDVHNWTDEEVCEYARAVHGRRLLSTSGSFHAVHADEDNTPDVTPPSVHLCSVHVIHAAEQRGSHHAAHAADILSRMSNQLALALDRPFTAENTTLPPVDRREVVFALGVCAELEALWPKLPDPADLERFRRHAFSEPEPPPPPRERQTALSDRYGW